MLKKWKLRYEAFDIRFDAWFRRQSFWIQLPIAIPFLMIFISIYFMLPIFGVAFVLKQLGVPDDFSLGISSVLYYVCFYCIDFNKEFDNNE